MRYKLLLALLIVITLGLLGYYLSKQKVGNAPYNPQHPVNNSASITLPIDPSAQGVYATAIVYTFAGKVTDITQQDKDLILKLDLETQGLPVFITSPSTSVIIQNKGKSTQGSFSDVKVGQHVLLPTTYDLKDKTWLLQNILIQE